MPGSAAYTASATAQVLGRKTVKSWNAGLSASNGASLKPAQSVRVAVRCCAVVANGVPKRESHHACALGDDTSYPQGVKAVVEVPRKVSTMAHVVTKPVWDDSSLGMMH